MNITRNGIRILVPRPQVRGRECYKVRHKTRDEAFDHLVSYEQYFHDYTLKVYRCRWCKGYWHIGHPEKHR